MKKYWLQFNARVNAMNWRERALVFATAAVVVGSALNQVLLEPVLNQHRKFSAQVKENRARLVLIQAQLAALAQGEDPDAPLRSRSRSIKREIAKVDGALQGMQKKLVAPNNMANVLEDILSRNRQLRLVALKTLPAAPLVEKSEQQPASPESNPAKIPAEVAKSAHAAARVTERLIYKHGVEITVQGSYPELLHYLAELESLPWQMYWSGLKLKVDAYPRARMTLTLYTLSLDKVWMSV